MSQGSHPQHPEYTLQLLTISQHGLPAATAGLQGSSSEDGAASPGTRPTNGHAAQQSRKLAHRGRLPVLSDSRQDGGPRGGRRRHWVSLASTEIEPSLTFEFSFMQCLICLVCWPMLFCYESNKHLDHICSVCKRQLTHRPHGSTQTIDVAIARAQPDKVPSQWQQSS